MNTFTDTLTKKLHDRSDRKLIHYCDQKLGGLFDECGSYHDCNKPALQDFLEVKKAMDQCGLKDQDAFPWHGYVWELAKTTLFAMLRDKWREREIADFIAQVEDNNTIWEGGDA